MAKITLDNFNLGGLSQSKYQGSNNSMYRLTGFDLHSEPGTLKVGQKLTKESGTTIDDFVKKILVCSDGNSYLFGSTTGKIWKRTGGGVYSLEATGAHGGITDAIEDNGKIYYFFTNYVGRIVIGDAWSTRNDSWAVFNYGVTSKHPVKKVNLTVYIGDGQYIAQIKNDVFTDNALDLESGFEVSALGQYDTKLLIGATSSSGGNRTNVYQWDTWSESFSSSDSIPELSVNAFFDTDNRVIVSCGTKGNLYQYSGGILVPIDRIQGNWIVGNGAIVHNNAVSNYGGINLFGVSNYSNNPALCGVYGLGGYSVKYPQIMSLDYVISQNKTEDIEIGAMAIINDLLLVSWKDGTTYGIDKLDSTLKYEHSSLETRIMFFDRNISTTIKKIYIYYRLKPASTNVLLYASVNYEAYVQVTNTNFQDKMMYFTPVMMKNVYALQLKMEPEVNGNDAFEIESIVIET